MTQSSSCGYVFHHTSDTTFGYFSLESIRKERLTLGAGGLVPGFRHTRVLYLHHGSLKRNFVYSRTRLVFKEKRTSEK